MDTPASIAVPHSTTLLHIQAWTPTLWSLRLSRPDGFSFLPGHYARLGFEQPDGTPLWRAYSIVSAPHEPELEFLIGLLPDGAFCSHLAQLQTGDRLLLDRRAMGFFVADQLAAGDSLWLLASGTGVGPYVSLLRQQQMIARFARRVLVHSVRHAADLAYGEELRALAGASGGAVDYIPVVTREPGATRLQRRIPQLLEEHTLQQETGLDLDPAGARVMVCGNPEFTAAMRRLLTERGFLPCRRGLSGSMLFENYW